VVSPPAAASTSSTASTTFAVIGDYGVDDSHERAVADLVASWDPLFIIATGDDYYREAGGTGASQYDESTGKYFRRWLGPVEANMRRGLQAAPRVNAFFPSLGNHDYSDALPSPQTYLDYFTLPGNGSINSSGNERYYDFVEGPVHFFVINSNPDEPDGTSAISRQARWLESGLQASTSAWNIVYGHHAPYASDGTHGSFAYMRWPFAEWGADVVISGHAHVYERVSRDGIVYFVNGLGGAVRYGFDRPIAGSRARYSAGWGAQRVIASQDALRFEFRRTDGTLVDSHRLSIPTRYLR